MKQRRLPPARCRWCGEQIEGVERTGLYPDPTAVDASWWHVATEDDRCESTHAAPAGNEGGS